MRLIDSLYTLTAREAGDGRAECAIRLNPDHLIYRAHFPGNPITPGVCLLQMVTELLNIDAARPLTVARYKNVKFLHTLSPDLVQTVAVTIDTRPAPDGMLKVTASIHDLDVEYARISAFYS